MADYQAFEQQYPTLNKFVGAAREAAAVMPGVNFATPRGQNYDDARQRFQQQSPYAAAAGTGLGYGLDLAATGGALGALGRTAAGPAFKGVMAETAADAAGGGRLGLIAQQSLDSGAAKTAAQAAAANAPRYLMPTLTNTLSGMKQAGELAGPAAKAALGIGAKAANYAPMVAPVAAPMVGAMMSGRGSSPQNPAVENSITGAAPSKTLDHFRPNELGLTAGGIKDNSIAAHAGGGGSEPMSYLNTPMFYGDDQTRPLVERVMAAKISQRPHYTSAHDVAANLTMAIAKERYKLEFQRAQGDPKAEQTAYDRWLQAIGNLGGATGPYAQMGYAPTPQADDGWF